MSLPELSSDLDGCDLATMYVLCMGHNGAKKLMNSI